jgi:hypothetical protein
MGLFLSHNLYPVDGGLDGHVHMVQGIRVHAWDWGHDPWEWDHHAWCILCR